MIMVHLNVCDIVVFVVVVVASNLYQKASVDHGWDDRYGGSSLEGQTL